MNLYEFVSVGVQKQTGGYPFGSEGPVPWYYKTAELYAHVCLVWGLGFLSLLTGCIIVFAKKKKYVLPFLLVTIIYLIVLQILNGQSG